MSDINRRGLLKCMAWSGTGVLWTVAHHQIPLLYVMHNNRGYHQEVMHVQRLSNRRNRVGELPNSR